MKRALFALAFVSALCVAATGCGGGSVAPPPRGGGGFSTPTPTASPSPTPVPIATQTPFQTQAVATLAPAAPVQGQTPAPVPVTLPAGGGVSGTMNLPTSGSAISPGTQIALQLQNTAPAGLPALQSAARRVSIVRPMASAPISVIAYLGILFSQDLVLSHAPAFTFSLPSADVPAGTAYYLALFNPNQPTLGWQVGFEGPGTVSGTSVTFTSQSTNLYFQAWTWYYLGLYASPLSAATPSPAPSVAPTLAPTAAPSSLPTSLPPPTPSPSPAPGTSPTPAPAFELVPSQLSFNGTGLTQSFSAVDFSYGGSFTATTSDAGVATVSVSGSAFTVTSVGAGTATITVSESNGKTAACAVTVTTTTIPVN